MVKNLLPETTPKVDVRSNIFYRKLFTENKKKKNTRHVDTFLATLPL